MASRERSAGATSNPRFSKQMDAADKQSSSKIAQALDNLPYRHALRTFLETLKAEILFICILIVYMVLILLDLVLQEDVTGWRDTFKWIDLVFLVFFTSELAVRVYAYGLTYLKSFLNVFDALIVTISFVLQAYAIAHPDQSSGGTAFLSVLRLVRLARLLVVMKKVQEARAAYKKAKFMKLASPVETVMEILGALKERCEGDELITDLEWIMQLIVSEKLYSVDLNSMGGEKVDPQMNAWLIRTMGIGAEDLGQSAEDARVVLEATIIDAEQPTSVRSDALSALSSKSDSSAAAAFPSESEPAADEEKARLDLCRELTDLPNLQPHLAKVYEWHVNPFLLHEESRKSGLVVCAHKLFSDYGLIDRFRLPPAQLVHYFRRIQEGYIDTPFHNCCHALDVMLNTSYFIRQKELSRLMKPLDVLSCLLAAAVHDHEHPGVNNNFLSTVRHDWAIKYNDQSVLESHHVASAWAILIQDEYNFLRNLSKHQYREVRSLVIQLVMGTDMRYHFEHLSKLKTKIAQETFQPGCRRNDVRFLLSCAVHVADISNPAKPLGLMLKWTERVMEEFFRQGDLEVRMNMPISPFYDREKTSVSACQIGFINVIIKPLFVEFLTLLGEPALQTVFEDGLTTNLKAWEAFGNQLMGEGFRKSTMPADGTIKKDAGAGVKRDALGVSSSKFSPILSSKGKLSNSEQSSFASKKDPATNKLRKEPPANIVRR